MSTLSRDDLHAIWSDFLNDRDISNSIDAVYGAIMGHETVDFAITILISYHLKKEEWSKVAFFLLHNDPLIQISAAKELKAVLDLRTDLVLSPLLETFTVLIDDMDLPIIMQESAIRALALIAHEKTSLDSIVPVLEKMLITKNKTIRANAAKALTYHFLSQKKITLLKRLLINASPLIRSKAIEACADGYFFNKIKPEAIMTVILNALEDLHKKVRSAAALSLKKIITNLIDANSKIIMAKEILGKIGSLEKRNMTSAILFELKEDCEYISNRLIRHTDLDEVYTKLAIADNEEKISMLHDLVFSVNNALDITDIAVYLGELVYHPHDEISGLATMLCVHHYILNEQWNKVKELLKNPERKIIIATISAIGIAGMQLDISPLISSLIQMATNDEYNRELAQETLDNLLIFGKNDMQQWVHILLDDFQTNDISVKEKVAEKLKIAHVRGYSIPEDILHKISS